MDKKKVTGKREPHDGLGKGKAGPEPAKAGTEVRLAHKEVPQITLLPTRDTQISRSPWAHDGGNQWTRLFGLGVDFRGSPCFLCRPPRETGRTPLMSILDSRRRRQASGDAQWL